MICLKAYVFSGRIDLTRTSSGAAGTRIFADEAGNDLRHGKLRKSFSDVTQ
jgi:hypothetical protein